MNMNQFFPLVGRVLFFVALAMLAIASFEFIANWLGYTLLRQVYSAGRLVELSAALLLFPIAILLRQIRDALKATGGSA